VQEADGDRPASLRHQPRPRRPHGVFVERRQHARARRHPLRDLQPPAPRHQRVRKFQEQVVDVVALLDAQLEHVAEALRRDQAERRAAALD
jgi:hypothetical protein